MEYENDETKTQTDKPKHVTLEVQSLRHEVKIKAQSKKEETSNGQKSIR